MSVFTEPEYRFTAQLFGGKRLVTCQSSNSMLVTDHDGTISMVVKAGFQMPQDIAVLIKTGEVFVVDRYVGCVKVFQQLFNDADTTTPCRFRTIGAGMLNQPVGIAIDEDADLLYVADNENHRIAVFTTGGVFMKALGSGYGQEPGQLYCPCGVALYKGLLFVAEWGNGRLQVFNSDGKSMLIVNGIQHAHHVIASPEGEIFVAQYSHKRVRMLKVTVDENRFPIFTVKDDFLQLDAPPTSLFWDNGLGVVTNTRLLTNVLAP